MTKLGFARTNQQRLIAICGLAVHAAQRFGFDRVTQRRAGAMRFNVGDLSRADAGPLQCGTDHLLLGGAIRCSQITGHAILIDRSCCNQRQDLVAVRFGLRARFQYQYATAFATHIPIGAVGESPADTVRR